MHRGENSGFAMVIKTSVAIFSALAVLILACGEGREAEEIENDFICSGPPADYRVDVVSWPVLLEKLAHADVPARLPPRLTQNDESTLGYGKLRDPHHGVVVNVPLEDDAFGAIIFSRADNPACSGPPSNAEPVAQTSGGLNVYSFQFSSSVAYVSWFKTSENLAVEISIFWPPNDEPSLAEQLDGKRMDR